MARTAGSTSFITVPLATLQAEIAAGFVPDQVIISKTWWTGHQLAKIEAGGVVPVTYATAPTPAAGKAAGDEQPQEDDTPLEVV